jgi:hypothetical protein
VDESAKAVVSLNLVGRVIVLKKRPLESARSGAVLSPPKRHKGVPPSSSGVLAHRAHRSDVESADRASKRVETCSFRCFRASGEASAMGSAVLNHIAARGSPRRRIVDLDRVAGAERGDGRGRCNNVRSSLRRPCPSAPVSLARPLC